MRNTVFLILIAFFPIILSAQIAPDKYFIGFRDKNNSPYSLDRPQEFLSQRAVERRQRLMISLEENDLPVISDYVETIANLGVTVINQSKWLNGITIFTTNMALLDTILSLPFVLNVVRDKNKFKEKETGEERKNKFDCENSSASLIREIMCQPWSSFTQGDNYGRSYRQIQMVNGVQLHQMGYRGEGMVIAILDAGFFQVNTLPSFDSLWHHDQILGTRDFVNPGNDVFQEHPHGMEVLSVMGGNLPGQLLGTAPKAGYWLLRSEDSYSENLIEEYNWVTAAEYADSVGADVINSSLGYSTFDDPSKNHRCSDMDGNTTVVTRGANIAGSKGMIVVNSAGNSGGTTWRCISAPADGNSVMGIAAVDSLGHYAYFSSTGKVDSRVKPNIAAMGKHTVVAATGGGIMQANGTSFSAPVIAGMVACLWQSSAFTNNYQIIRSIEVSSSQFTSPDSLLGYGIPDFVKALNSIYNNQLSKSKTLIIYPNPFTEGFTLEFFSEQDQIIDIILMDQLGREWRQLIGFHSRAGLNRIPFNGLGKVNPGYYFIKISGEKISFVSKLVKVL